MMRRTPLYALICAAVFSYGVPSAASPDASSRSSQSAPSAESPSGTSRPVTGSGAASASSLDGAAAATSLAAAALPAPARDWDRILRHYLAEPDSDGVARFDYGGLLANTDDVQVLHDYIDYLQAQDPKDLNDAEAIVFWANLYNAVTIRLIIDHYPVSSIRKIKSGLFSMGPWGKKLITVNGERMSLDHVEHEILRAKYPSPLIHYMVNCASIGCPNLKEGLWRAETLDEDRAAAARAFINSPRGVRVTNEGLIVSNIYQWFKQDFGGSKSGIIAHLQDYAYADLLEILNSGAGIDGYDYDWSLNRSKDNY